MAKDYDPDSPEAKACMSQPGGVATLHPSPTNPRKTFNAAEMAELTESVRLHGVLQPLLVRCWPVNYPYTGDMPYFEIVAGERRYRAAKAAGLALVPILVRNLTDREVLEIQVIENLQRSDLHPMEEAEGYELMMQKHGYSADDLAEKIGKSRSYIFGRLKLLDLDEDCRRMFLGGLLNASTALLVARIPTASLRAKAVKEITEQNHHGDVMSVRAAQRHLQNRFMLRLAAAPFPIWMDDLLPAAGSCVACPKRTGNAPADLFEDVDSPDVCTDPDCHAEKKQAHKDRESAKVKEAGGTVIEGEAAKKLAQYGIESYTTLKGFTQLDNKCHEDPEQRTYREIIGDDVPPVLVEDVYRQKMVPVVPNAILAEKLQAAGIKLREAEQANEKVSAQLKLERLTRERLYEQLREETAGMANSSEAELPYEEQEHILSLVTQKLWERTGFDVTSKIATLWGAVGKTATDRVGAFEQSIPNLSSSDCWRLLVDILAFSGKAVTSEWDLKHGGKSLLHLAETVFGLNPAAARKAVAAELKAKEQEAKPAKKTAKKPAKNATPDASADHSYPSKAAQAQGVDAREEAAPGNEINTPETGTEPDESETNPPADAGIIETDEKQSATELDSDRKVGDFVKISSTAKNWRMAGNDAVIIGVIRPGAIYKAKYGPSSLEFSVLDEHEISSELPPGKKPSWMTEEQSSASTEANEKPSKPKRIPPKYRHPEEKNLDWTGRGKPPRWVEHWLATPGNTLDMLKVEEEQSSAADAANEKPIAVFYPADKEERETFYSCYCRHCAKDQGMREGLSDMAAVPDGYLVCDLVGASSMYKKDADGYPKEWRYQGGAATCTAFVEFGTDPAPERCDKTVDMFQEAGQ